MINRIISFSLGGISNRIKCLVSSIKISEEHNKELLLYWPKDLACNCNFTDLFENQIKEVSKDQILESIKKNERYNDPSFKAFSNKDIHLKFNKIPLENREEILKYLHKLKIKKNILENVEKFSKKFNKNTIGVHIRGGDFKILKSGLGNVSKQEDFIKEMQKEIENNPKTNFFLAAEDKETENKFKNLFKNKIITYPKKTKLREEENSVQEAFIEILLLSKTKKIIGTFGSTFTELAWFFGKCKPDVKIIINEEERKKYFKQLRKRESYFRKLKIFIYNLYKLITTPKSKRLFRTGVK